MKPKFEIGQIVKTKDGRCFEVSRVLNTRDYIQYSGDMVSRWLFENELEPVKGRPKLLAFEYPDGEVIFYKSDSDFVKNTSLLRCPDFDRWPKVEE